jgi:hypothetical protein
MLIIHDSHKSRSQVDELVEKRSWEKPVKKNFLEKVKLRYMYRAAWKLCTSERSACLFVMKIPHVGHTQL